MAGAGGEGRYSCTPGEQKCISVLEAEVTVVSLLQAFWEDLILQESVGVLPVPDSCEDESR